MDKFIQWSQLIMCGKIKPNEKIVLMVILNCNNMAWPFIANTEIIRQSGLSERTVQRTLAKLKKMGLITEVKTNTNNMNNYIVSGVNLTSLITSGVNLTTQVVSKTTTSGVNLTGNNNINKKNIERDIDNNMDYNNSTGRDTTGHSNNNMDFKKNGMYMELNSHTTVQSKETKEKKTHSSSAGTTRVFQIGDTRYVVEDEEDILSKLPPIPSSSVSREKKKVQQITTTEDRKDNTLSNASLHNKNEDNPMDCCGRSIDDLENVFNGGNPSPTKTISKGGSQTTSKAKSNEGGGGCKFTPRKEWELLMENINTKVNNNIKPTLDEMNIIMEGARDKYRVITTLKVLYKMLFFRLKVNGYGVILTTCGDTLDDNKEAYTQKQYDFAWNTYDQCADQFDIFKLENPTLNK